MTHTDILEVLKAAKVALESSKPEMAHYPEPVARHAEALRVVVEAVEHLENVGGRE